MKKLMLIGAFALLAACGSSDKDVSKGTDNSATDAANDTSIGGSDDTITVNDFRDMPPKCIELLGQFLKKIEPTVSAIDWEKATLGDFEKIGTQFDADSNSFDTDLAATGCDKYNLDNSDASQFEQMEALAAVKAPGTVGFLKFLNSLTTAASGDGEAVPTDCDGTIAAIEPFLAKGTMQDLTMAEVTRVGQLMTAVSANCTAEQSTAFYGRDDVTAFIGG
ncbi:MAG: hypothetical protein ABI894_02380 [Ilumatobacteraceae bacterium]